MATPVRVPALPGRPQLSYLAFLLALVGPMIGCASSTALETPTRVVRVRYSPYVLTRAELAGPSAESSSSLYDAVRTLRPLWLNDRGPQSFLSNPPVQVALDGQLVGDIANLREFRASDVEEARILDTAEAGTRYGMRAQSQRVIELTSRRGGPR